MLTLYTKNVEDVWFGVACENERIFATAFSSSKSQVLHGLLRSVPFNVPFKHLEKTTEFARQVIYSLADIYAGRGCFRKFNLAMEPLSDYSKKVLGITALIPVGYVTFYGSVAEVAGGSPRAVGRVMALNPFPLIVPCHRVVASDFSLGGYGGGLKAKLEILKREKRGYAADKRISVDDGGLRVFPVEFMLEKHLGDQ